ncbi:MAG: hypothetical protein J3K34DRAFT_406414, partial [Monoraphidium minutum]
MMMPMVMMTLPLSSLCPVRALSTTCGKPAPHSSPRLGVSPTRQAARPQSHRAGPAAGLLLACTPRSATKEVLPELA